MQSCQSAQNESILERHIKFNRKSAGTRCLPVFGDEIANSGSSCKHFFFSSIFLSLMGKRLFGSMTAELYNPFRKNFKRSPVYYLLNYVPPKGSGGGWWFTCTVPMVMGQTKLWPCMIMQNQTFRKAARGP